jgi:hypothetical protein
MRILAAGAIGAIGRPASNAKARHRGWQPRVSNWRAGFRAG